MKFRWLYPLVLFIILIAGGEFLIRNEWLNPSLFPAPSAVLATFSEMKGEFLKAFLESATGAIAGYVLAALGGLLVAFALSLSQTLRAAILPYAIFFQTVPVVAIAPLMVIYFGFGLPTVVASSSLVAVFPVLAGTLIGLQSMEREELELFDLYGANSWQKLKSLRLPKAYIAIYTGLKTAAGLSVIGAVAGEFVAGGGLGGLIDAGRTQQRLDIVYASLLLLSLLALAMVAALQAFNVLVNSWRPLGLNLKD